MVIGSHWIPDLWWLVIPIWLPLVFILGQEWEVAWGFWGARAWCLFGPLPYVLLCSWILALLCHRTSHQDNDLAERTTMWTRRISSGTPKHPRPKDVLRALLSRMTERGVDSSWAHFEVIADGGWFKNLLYGNQPWVEVALVNQQSLQLNPGVAKAKRAEMPTMPENWVQTGKRLWTVPLADVEELIDWTDKCLAGVSGNPNYQVSGWIEGL